jgi:rod shape-determining protein MreC
VAVRDANAPYGRFALTIRNAVSGLSQALGDSVEIRQRIQQLEDENETLRASLLRHGQVVREVDELRGALGLVSARPDTICADVLSRGDSGGWWREIRLDKGSSSGVHAHAPVVAAAGLVGRVVRVTDDTADVLLLPDANSKVACVVEGEAPGARGIVVGGGIQRASNELELLHVVEPLSLAYLDKAVDIRPGARVVTSGLGGVYPAGIPVGEIQSTSPDSTRLYQRALVAPYVDFASLHRVFVLARHPSASAAPAPGRGGRR